MQYEEEQIHIYEELIRYIQDDGADEAFSYLLDSAKKAMDTLRNLLHILTTHTEMKDFEMCIRDRQGSDDVFAAANHTAGCM